MNRGMRRVDPSLFSSMLPIIILFRAQWAVSLSVFRLRNSQRRPVTSTRAKLSGIVVAAFCLIATEESAWAFVSVRCDLAPTTALGTALVSNNTPGTVFAITGMCQQSVQLTLTVVSSSAIPSGIIALTNELGDPTGGFIPGDGIEGQLTIVGAGTALIDGILLSGTGTDTGLTSNVLVELGASAIFTNDHIEDGQRVGLIVMGNSSAVVTSTFIQNNGIANIAGQNDGLRVVDGSTALLGGVNNDGSINSNAAAVVAGNACNGIVVVAGSRLVMAGGRIGASGSGIGVTPNTGDQLFLAGGSVAGLYDVQVSQASFTPSPSGFAIEDQGSSALLLADGTTVNPGSVSCGIAVRGGSSLTTNGSTVFATGSSPLITAIQASGDSSVILAGGNSIGSSFGSTAFLIDHSSSLIQTRPGGSLATIAGVPIVASTAAESIQGAGSIQVQSSMELGLGNISLAPSITWTGSIVVAQNSSLRLSGGVSISGSVKLSRASNGFFNVANGGTNSVTGNVTCPWTTVPAAHVSGPAAVMPSLTLATSFASASPGQCLPF